jgi:hypothetical protein
VAYRGRWPVGVTEENLKFEEQWGLRTNAARALAELGDNSGLLALTELLEADQSRLRSYARKLLEQITGQSFGRDRRAWEFWLHQPESPNHPPR